MMGLDEASLRAAFVRYRREREGAEHRSVFEEEEPLISVCIHTYNRAELLRTRSIPSVLAQTYRNLELVVVGDHCTDGTEEAVASFKDPRIRFENLPTRMDYAPYGGWNVAGTLAVNRALQLARGSFITHLDDDDRYHHQRLEICLREARRHRLEFIFHSFLAEGPDGQWRRILSPDGQLRFSTVTTSSTFYHRFFKDLPWDLEAYSRWGEPGDWNRYKKFGIFGASMGYLAEDLLAHYREGQNVYGSAAAAVGARS